MAITDDGVDELKALVEMHRQNPDPARWAVAGCGLRRTGRFQLRSRRHVEISASGTMGAGQALHSVLRSIDKEGYNMESHAVTLTTERLADGRNRIH